MKTALLLDGPLNGQHVPIQEAFDAGYVFDRSTSEAWANEGERGDVMVHEHIARNPSYSLSPEVAEALL